jgi:hypothetical protein
MSIHPDVIAVSTGHPVLPDPEPAPVTVNTHPGPDLDYRREAA